MKTGKKRESVPTAISVSPSQNHAFLCSVEIPFLGNSEESRYCSAPARMKTKAIAQTKMYRPKQKRVLLHLEAAKKTDWTTSTAIAAHGRAGQGFYIIERGLFLLTFSYRGSRPKIPERR